jgi:hypothetical protein
MSALDDYLCVHQSFCASWLSLEAGKCDCGLNEAIDDLAILRKRADQLNIDLLEVMPIIDKIIRREDGDISDAWALAISWKRNYARDIHWPDLPKEKE